MHHLFLESPTPYTGAELSHQWVRRHTQRTGDAIIAFIGPCDVQGDHMVDLEDLAAKAWIKSDHMVHFIVEHEDRDLEKAVLRQLRLIHLIQEAVVERANVTFTRRGNDLYIGDGKLNVSIATTSPVSTLIHVGVNITITNTPVTTAGLANLHIDPVELAHEILERYTAEHAHVRHAMSKVRGVSE